MRSFAPTLRSHTFQTSVCVVEIKSSDNLVGVRAWLDCLFDLSRIGQKLNEKLNMLFACLSGS